MERRCTARVNGPAAVKSLAAAVRREAIEDMWTELNFWRSLGRKSGVKSEL